MRAVRPDERMQRRFKILRAFERVGVFFFSSSAMMVLRDDVGTRNRLARAEHAELKFVAREGERRRAVAVGRVLRNGGSTSTPMRSAPFCGRCSRSRR